MSGDGSERHSLPGVAPPPPADLTQEEEAEVEARNGLRQFDRMIELIDKATKGSGAQRFRLRPSTINELNRLAVEGLQPNPGAFRLQPITISKSKHSPPDSLDVPSYVDDMCDYINDGWDVHSGIHLAGYAMWRLNWIHPFTDGNGRTSRVVSYLTLCAKLGYRLPGTKTIPERIAANKGPYYEALDAADAAWRDGRVDVSRMEDLLQQELAVQLVSVYDAAVSAERILTTIRTRGP
jgi:Fic family protein